MVVRCQPVREELDVLGGEQVLPVLIWALVTSCARVCVYQAAHLMGPLSSLYVILQNNTKPQVR